ncbi:hypothetical protein GCM10028805_19730 [Spirosoma harenae]
MKTVLFISLIFGLTACGNLSEEVVPDGLGAGARKLVVACFISPQDTILTAKVAYSRPLLANDPTRNPAVSDAAVTLSDGPRSVSFVYNKQLGYYQANAQSVPIVAGQTYNLTVKAANGQQVTASARVPDGIPIQSIDVTWEKPTSGNGIQLMTRTAWQDPANATNFYQLRGQIISQPANPREPIVSQPVIFAGNEQGLFTDDGNNGTLLISTPGYVDNVVGSELVMKLWHLDAPYYQYHQALSLQLAIDGDPFAELVPIPTNIQGGLGCFGAYNQVIATRSLR